MTPVATVRRLLGVTVAVMALGVPAASAETSGPPTGQRCRFESVAFSGSDTWTGVIAGGPLAAPGSTISMRCSIHVNNETHAGSAVVSETTAPTPAVTVLPPTTMSFVASVFDIVSLCTEATVDATVWYLTGNATDERWTTDATAPCFVDPVGLFWTVYYLLPPPARYLVGVVVCVWSSPGCSDAVVCAELQALAPGVPGVVEIRPDGDVYIAGEWIWDCPSNNISDAVVCAELQALAPGVPGVVDIRPDGDVYIAGEWIWDCPPYNS